MRCRSVRQHAGGTVYVGVNATRKGAPRGVENPEGAVVFLRKEMERNITPQLDARVDVVQSLGAPIVRVSVPTGPDKPYALAQTQILVRQEGETDEAVRDEIVQLVLGGRQAAAIAEVEQTLGPVPETVKEPVPAYEQLGIFAEPPASDLPLPSVGVEIIAVEERQATRYFTIRDLRNGGTVQNVTPASARKLWSYAITQHLTHPVDPAGVTWQGEFGLWKAERRAKKLRYDLALRQPDGTLRVFYGVTEDGMTGPWAVFLKVGAAVAVEAITEDGFEGEATQALEPGILAEVDVLPKAEAGAEAKPKAKPRRRHPRGAVRPESQGDAEAKPGVKPEPPVIVETDVRSELVAFEVEGRAYD